MEKKLLEHFLKKIIRIEKVIMKQGGKPYGKRKGYDIDLIAGLIQKHNINESIFS